ncbi:MAG: SH3 domain-containing protein [Muribaculum sp.]|nr:SH3 domain-containing protein [Muribaculum sp.]
MWKDKLRFVRDYLMKNSKIAFPVIVVAAVAVTVSIALGASSRRSVEDIVPGQDPVPESSSAVVGDVPLVDNESGAISELIYTFYNAQALGDLETLQALCDEISELDLLSFEEKAQYIDYYPALDIYTKQGMNEGETIVYVYYRMTFANHDEEFPGYTSHYVCTAEDGSLYIKRSNFSDELNEYISMVCTQDDVVEFNNHVIAEYDAFKEEHPELADYPEEVMTQVNMTVGVKWSEMQSAAGSVSDNDVSTEEPGGGQENNTEPVEQGPMYATATTTVNVRSSDSEQADRLGKLAGGERIQVTEQRVNGWSQVIFENKEGYIKSEYLLMEESAAGLEAIGTVRATTTVNVRAGASTEAAQLGVLAGGDTAELVAVEGDWCKIKYNGRTAYVKGEFVERQ